MSTGLHCFLVGVIVYWQGAIVNFVRSGKHGSTIALERNDGEGKGGRSVTGVHRSVTGLQSNTVNGGMETRESAKKCNGGMASQFTTMYDVYLGMGM